MDFTLLGDPHLGRTFVHGVPLHRRGEREVMMWRNFAQSLSNVTTPLHICLGDLFDRAGSGNRTRWPGLEDQRVDHDTATRRCSPGEPRERVFRHRGLERNRTFVTTE